MCNKKGCVKIEDIREQVVKIVEVAEEYANGNGK